MDLCRYGPQQKSQDWGQIYLISWENDNDEDRKESSSQLNSRPPFVLFLEDFTQWQL